MSELRFISEDYVPKGDIEGFPLEVVDRMVFEQVKQGNEPDVTIFEENRCKGKEGGGFTWEDTEERGIWRDCIDRVYFGTFNDMYKGAHIIQGEYDEVMSGSVIEGHKDERMEEKVREYQKDNPDPIEAKALRYNSGKLKTQLPDPKCFMEEVKIHTMGSEKYEAFNWKKGQSFLEAIGSLKRHINKFEQGINYDDDYPKETLDKYGLGHHLANIKWQADALLYQFFWARENDDRQYKADQRIGLDIDGVLADFGACFLDRAVEMGLIIQEEKELPLVHWNDYRFRENFETVTKDDEFWLTLEPIVEGRNLMFEPCVYITARNVDTSVTKAWLRKWGFPTAPVETVGLGQSKLEALKKHRVEIFVEDNYGNWRDAMNAGVFSFLVTRGHNKKYDIPGFNRINCVSELKSFGK